METVNVNIRFPKVLWDQREKVRQATGAKSVNAMVVALYAYTMMHGREHWLTNAIFQLPADQQAEALEGMVVKFLAGEKKRGNSFETMMENAVKSVAAGKTIPKESVISEMISDLREAGRRTQ